MLELEDEEEDAAVAFAPQIVSAPFRTFLDLWNAMEDTNAFSVFISSQEILFLHQAFSVFVGLFPNIFIN